MSRRNSWIQSYLPIWLKPADSKSLLKDQLTKLVQNPQMKINRINHQPLLDGLIDLFQKREQIINKYVPQTTRNRFLIQVNQILRKYSPCLINLQFIQKQLGLIFQNFRIKQHVDNCQHFILNLTQQWTESIQHLNQNKKKQLFDQLTKLQNLTKKYLQNSRFQQLQPIPIQFFISNIDYQTKQALICKQENYLQTKWRILNKSITQNIISQKIVNQDKNAWQESELEKDENRLQLVQLIFYFSDHSDHSKGSVGLKFQKMKNLSIKYLQGFKGILKYINVKLFLNICIISQSKSTFIKVPNFIALKDLKKMIAQKDKIQQNRIQLHWAKNEEIQKQLDDEFVCSYQSFQQTLCPNLTINLKRQLQHYGFNINCQFKSNQFKFFIEDEYSQKQLIQACNKSQNEPGANFTIWLCRFCYNYIKKGFNFMHVIERYRQQLNVSLGSSSIWDKQLQKKYTTLNSKFILFYLLSNSDPKLKINIMRIISKFSPIPIILRQFQTINNIGFEFIKNKQIKYVLKEGITITSIGFQKNKIGLKGKSDFLSKVFFIDQDHYQKRHPICQYCPLLYLRIFGDKHKINIIDVPSGTKQETINQILKVTNFLIIQTWETQTDVREYLQQLKRQGFNEIVYIFIKDQSIKLRQQNVKIGNGKITYLPNLKDSSNTHMNYFYIRDSLFTDIKLHKPNINQKKIIQLYQQPQVSQFRQILNQITIENIYSLKKLGLVSQKMKNNYYSNDQLKNIAQQNLIDGFHPILKKIFQMFANAQDYYVEIYSHLFKQKLKDIKTESMNLFDLICLYKKKSEILTDSTSENSRAQLEQMKISLQGKKLGNLAYIDFQYQGKSIQQIQQFFSQKISQFKQKIQPKIFSYELAWRQIIAWLKLKQIKNQRFQSFQQNLIRIKRQQIKNSIPFQVIDGDLLEMPKLLLSEVFNTDSKVCVISILGPQSSGKSTLLNFLFGCDFTASEGRCTRGVYGTYFELNKKQAQRLKYQTILLLDTQGIMANTSLIDQQKRNNFDQKLMLFCLTVSDVVLINTKGNIDKNTSDLLQFCKQKLDNMKNAQKNLPLYYLIQNMNLGNSMIEHNFDINRLRNMFDLNNSKSLSYGYQTLHIKRKQVSLLMQEEEIIKKLPKEQFREDTLNVLISMFNALKGQKRFYRKIKQIIDDIQRQWATIQNFPSLFLFNSKEAQQIQNIIVAFQKQGHQKLKKYKMNLIQKFKKKELIQVEVKDHYNQFINITLKRYEQQIMVKKQRCLQKDSINLITSSLEKLKYKLSCKMNQFTKDLQQIKICKTYQTYKRQGLQILKKISQYIKNKIIKENVIFSQQQKVKIFQQQFQNYIQNLQKRINIPQQIQELISRIINLYQEAAKTSPCLTYGLPIIQQSLKQFFKSNQFLQIKQFKRLLAQKIFFGKIVQNKFFIKRSDKPHINTLKGGLYDPKLKYFDMTSQFQQVSKKYAVCFQKRYIQKLFNKEKIQNDFYQLQIAKKKEIAFLLNKILQDIAKKIDRFVSDNTQYRFVGITVFKNQYKNRKLFLNQFVHVTNKYKVLFKESNNNNNNYRFLNSTRKYFFSNIYQKQYQQILDTSYIQKFIQSDLQTKSYLIFKLIDFHKIQKLILKQKMLSNQLNSLNQIATPQLNEIIKPLHLKISSILNLLYGDIFKRHFDQNFSQKLIQFVNNPLRQYKNFTQIKQIVQNLEKSEIFVQNSKNQLYQKQINNEIRSDHVIGYYIKKQYEVKNIHEGQTRQLLSKYMSQDTQNVIKALNQENMTDFLKNKLKRDKKFQLFLDQTLRIIYENIQNLSQEREDVIYTIQNKISNQIHEFNLDLSQVGQQLDQNFIGFTHIYAIFMILRLHSQKFKKQKLAIVDLFKDIKEVQRNIFLKRCSQNQKQEIQAEVQQFKQQYNQLVFQKISQMKRDFIRQRVMTFKEKCNRKTIQDLIDLKVFGASSYTQQSIQQYIQNPYQILTTEFKKQQQRFFKSIQDSFKLEYANQASYYHLNMILQAKYLLQFLQKVHQITQEYAQLEDFMTFQIQQSVFIDQNSNIQGQQKLIFFKYFIDVLLSKVKKTYDSQRIHCRGIVRKERMFENRKCQLSKYNQNILQQINNNPNLSLSIKNICVFLQIMVNKFQSSKTLIAQELKFSQKDLQDFKLKTQVKFCQQKCPCCKRICGVEHNPSIFEPHKCIFGHQIRGFAKITLSNGYSSVKRCQEMKQNWKIKYNNKIVSWKEFKVIVNSNGPKRWVYDDCLNMNQDQQKQKQDNLFALAWRVYGKKFCQKSQIKYKSFQQTIEQAPTARIHYILALDESGSMTGSRWNSLIKCLQQIFGLLSQRQNVKISIITFNQNARIHQQYVSIQNLNINIQMRSGSTNFQHPFKLAGDIIERYIANQSISFIFMTDGEAQYPVQGVRRIKAFKKRTQHAIKYGSIAFGGGQIQVLKNIAVNLNGTNRQANNYDELLEAYQREMQILNDQGQFVELNNNEEQFQSINQFSLQQKLRK